MTAAPVADRLLPMTEADRRLETRLSAAVLAILPLLVFAFLAIAPALGPTFDDAKYVAVGRNVLDGDGPVTMFGILFLKHSPVWPVTVVLPERLLGVAALAVGHALNAVGEAATILLIGVLGWRVRPALGAIAASLFAALPYVFGVARTAGIDLPSIALTLGYVAAGTAIVRSGSAWRSALLGLVFAVAFLIKETIIPFAAVPFILAIMEGVPWVLVARTAAVTLAAAAIGTSWWFVMFAGYTHQVYRAGFPAWTLVPIAVAIVVLVLGGLAAAPLARTAPARRFVAALDRRAWGPGSSRLRSALGWLLVLAWFVALCVFFNRTPKLLGASLFDLDQLRAAIVGSVVSVRVSMAFGLGAAVVVAELVRDGRRVDRATRELLVATICGFPLILLVVAVGETPRHYLAELALILATGAVGWHLGLVRLRERDRATAAILAVALVLAAAIVGASVLQRVSTRTLLAAGVVVALAAVAIPAIAVWLRRRGRIGALVALAAAAAFVLATGVTVYRSVALASSSDTSEQRATSGAVGWIEANVPAGTTIAFGPYLSMETSIELPSSYRAVQVRHFLAIADPAAPLGLRSAAGTATDYVAADPAPGKSSQLNVYAASQLTGLLSTARAAYYVYPVARATSSQSVLGVLVPANGFTEVATLPYQGRTTTIDVHIFRIDTARLHIPADRLYISPEALARLVDRIARDPVVGRAAAAALVGEVVRPADGSLDASLSMLRTLAGQ